MDVPLTKSKTNNSVYGSTAKEGYVQLENPETSASWVSRLFFLWCEPLLNVGAVRQLNVKDVWALDDKMKCESCTDQLAKVWDGKSSLALAFLNLFGLKYAALGLLLAMGYGCNLFGPVVLQKVVSNIQSDGDIMVVWYWLALLGLSRVLKSLLFAHFYYISQIIFLQFTSAMKGYVYQKSFRLSAKSRMEKSTADIANIYTTDVNNIINAAFYFHYLWVFPLEIVIVLFMLYNVVGVATFAGTLVISLVLFINKFLANAQSKAFESLMDYKDERMKVINEIFGAIQIVKLNSWEEKFYEKLQVVRTKELEQIWRYMVMAGSNIFLLWGAPMFVSTITFAVYAVWMEQTLTAAKIFTAISLFRILQEPLRGLPTYITGLLQAGVSVKRFVAYARMEERDASSVVGLEDEEVAARYMPKDIVVAMDGATFTWEDKEDAVKVFDNVNLSIKHGEFLVVHGTVGSGKSSFCSALLGDMVKANGTVFVGGKIAYCPQQAWIQHMTIRDNIVFGNPWDKKKYDKVIEACGLTKDLELFSSGDLTEVGEKGLNVSGGQKARISLARACYSDADIFIFDSPLAAVDAIVQNQIFTKCLLGLLRNKTRILVTHNPEIIASEHVDRTIQLGVGQFKAKKGTSSGKIPVSGLPSFSPLIGRRPTLGGDEQRNSDVCQLSVPEGTSVVHEHSTDIHAGIDLASDGFTPLSHRTSSRAGAATPAGQLVAEENRNEGRVSAEVFMFYFNALGGIPVLTFLLCIQVLWQALQIGSDFWLSHWTAETDEEQQTNLGYNLGMYSFLALGGTVMVLARTLTISYQGIKGAKRMFDGMTSSLLKAPMSFFYANPLGRQLNRYSDDMSNVDIRIPFAFGTLVATVFSVGATLFTAAVLTRFLGVIIIPIVYTYFKIGSHYLGSARELQRLQKTTQSPVLESVSETVDGASVIRAFGAKSRFIGNNERVVDTNNMSQFALFATAEWFAMRMQLLGGLVLIVVTSSLTLMRNYLSAGTVGLAFNYALMVDAGLETLIQCWSGIETSMVSPERIAEYIHIDSEAAHEVPETEPKASWPEKGCVKFENVSFRYKAGGDLVLKDMTFESKPAEKIGIVGRTGAGKSSLTMALFRINEICAGMVSIDGIDTRTLGLRTLRSRLSIITQAPVLFKGTLRTYLDPFDQYTDDQLWSSLRKVGMADDVAKLEGKLDAVLEANGENFSVGERQLLCMARALLSSARVVIMDEATASIDQKTDEMLQKVIRTEFCNSTVITIAHRLDTVLDADRIMVLDAGRIVELDSPKALVKKGTGHFYDLAKEGGYLERMTM